MGKKYLSINQYRYFSTLKTRLQNTINQLINTCSINIFNIFDPTNKT